MNLLYLIPDRVGGTETYARELLRSFVGIAPGDLSFTLFVNPSAWDSFAWADNTPGWQRVLCPVPASASLRHLWEQRHFPKLCRRYQVDLLHSLAYVLPLRAKCRQIVTIHDALFLTGPGHLSLLKRWFWGIFVPRSARRADAVVTDSENSRRDLVRLLGLDPGKVHSILLGAGQPLPAATQWNELKNRYEIEQPYFISVGALPHKRLDLSADALQKVRVAHPAASLVVAGRSHEQPSDAGRAPGVHYVGYVPGADLAGLFAHAASLVCASEVEGFGLPVVEAMRLGTPAIVSDRGSLPEVAGDAGIVIPYGDAAALAAAMENVMAPEVRRRLGEQGREQARRFSWERCARETLSVYAAVLGIPAPAPASLSGGS
ncbi:MAG TPA: glycosyltransferase family 1 protein [Terriglobales bacterium]|nr:glycosyltransferase family 1 protein [Terriglobales bacterium]